MPWQNSFLNRYTKALGALAGDLSMRLSLTAFSLACFLPLSPLFAWGERGHDAVTRIATRLSAEGNDPAAASWGKLLAQKEHMMGHLSNVPDIVWRRLGPEIDRLNAPSHFIDIEYITDSSSETTLSALPKDFATYQRQLERNCKKNKENFACAQGTTIDAKLEKAGHAPFRIASLMNDITEALKQVKASESETKISKEARLAMVDQALLSAGIMAHFVGDLANPHHTSQDYDGWMSNGGGLHSYFESELVDAQDLHLEAAAFDEARRHQPGQRILAEGKGSALQTAWALALESHKLLPQLNKLDQSYARLKNSDSATRERAVRKAPELVRDSFRDLIVLRLAMGADVLKGLWTQAWVDAGKPDLSFYKSYNYPVQPEFIPLSYYQPSPKAIGQSKIP